MVSSNSLQTQLAAQVCRKLKLHALRSSSAYFVKLFVITIPMVTILWVIYLQMQRTLVCLVWNMRILMILLIDQTVVKVFCMRSRQPLNMGRHELPTDFVLNNYRTTCIIIIIGKPMDMVLSWPRYNDGRAFLPHVWLPFRFPNIR